MNNKVKSILRLLEFIDYSEIVNFLVENKFVSITDANQKNRPQERAELIYISLLEAEKKGDLLLLDFEWKILPLEQIKLTCVTAREERFFTHGY